MLSNVKIDYSTTNGTNWINIIASTPASAGSYSWTVPNTASTNCKVIISDVSNPLINDQSNTVFTIFTYPSLLLLLQLIVSEIPQKLIVIRLLVYQEQIIYPLPVIL